MEEGGEGKGRTRPPVAPHLFQKKGSVWKRGGEERKKAVPVVILLVWGRGKVNSGKRKKGKREHHLSCFPRVLFLVKQRGRVRRKREKRKNDNTPSERPLLISIRVFQGREKGGREREDREALYSISLLEKRERRRGKRGKNKGSTLSLTFSTHLPKKRIWEKGGGKGDPPCPHDLHKPWSMK